MYGLSDNYSYKDILSKVLEDLEKVELDARRNDSDAITGILIAEEIVNKHLSIDYC